MGFLSPALRDSPRMKIGKTRIEITGMDIAELDVQGIVNPANNMLWLGGGISAEIRHAGGDAIEQEALKKAPAAIGETIVTGAGSLHARWIFHAVIAGQDLVTTEDALRKAARAVLIQANTTGCRSLAVPLLTTGTHDIEVHRVAHIIVDEMVRYLVNENRSLERIVMAERDESTRHILETTLLEKFTKHA